MKFKDFRQTEIFKTAEVCIYYDLNNLPISNMPSRKKDTKEVVGFKWVQAPFKTLAITLNA